MFPPGGPYPHPEPPERVDDPVDSDDIDPFLYDPVLRWRAKELRRNGMIPPQARSLALDRTVDVHWVITRLLNRGCDPHTAFLIAASR